MVRIACSTVLFQVFPVPIRPVWASAFAAKRRRAETKRRFRNKSTRCMKKRESTRGRGEVEGRKDRGEVLADLASWNEAAKQPISGMATRRPQARCRSKRQTYRHAPSGSRLRERGRTDYQTG